MGLFFYYFSIVVSILALLFSFIAFIKTRKLDIEKINLDYRIAISEQLQECSNLLHNDFSKMKPSLSKLSTVLCRTNDRIGGLLDKYDTRDKNI